MIDLISVANEIILRNFNGNMWVTPDPISACGGSKSKASCGETHPTQTFGDFVWLLVDDNDSQHPGVQKLTSLGEWHVYTKSQDQVFRGFKIPWKKKLNAAGKQNTSPQWADSETWVSGWLSQLFPKKSSLRVFHYQLATEQRKKTWLLRLYMGLYHPVI